MSTCCEFGHESQISSIGHASFLFSVHPELLRTHTPTLLSLYRKLGCLSQIRCLPQNEIWALANEPFAPLKVVVDRANESLFLTSKSH